MFAVLYFFGLVLGCMIYDAFTNVVWLVADCCVVGFVFISLGCDIRFLLFCFIRLLVGFAWV